VREFARVLVANRGEIALRVIRALRALEIGAVAVYSDADRGTVPVREADAAYRMPGVYPSDTYLNGARIVELARRSDSDAIHPGYGFLSENAEFARLCKEHSIRFIGPSAETLAASGNKLECKKVAEAHGIPVVPYTKEPLDDARAAARSAEEIGFPVLLKSAFGGGGRGIREARTRDEVEASFETARREAQSSFGRSAVYIEKKLVRPRHVEVQILASAGAEHVVHLGERECSIQRRYQKLVEVSPSPVVTEAAREELARRAISLAKAVRYSNAGTVEFLRDAETGEFYFIEVNARLQVEHPVTELVTGIDLVASQIHVARHGTLPVRQTEVQRRGVAIECRVNSEDALAGFRPASGKVEHLRLPGGPGIRVDTALFEGVEVPPYYDSLLAKLIAWGASFDEARRRALVALGEFELTGVPSTIPFHRQVMAHPAFARGDWSTSFIEESGVLRTLAQDARPEAVHRFAIAALLLSKNQFRGSAGPTGGPTVRPRTLPSEHGGRFPDGI
jgi:acetyl/propionyl-CoA carboxylase alpha subunit